ncbi:NEW3 domain-containing protein [Bordetella sp. FB-8]|uniref:COG1470 family protein n=1 Tax=Bordetella sp. FB-8 TaxID=1159870 RepID=UPI00037C1575|nr:NEW3 domain-containing protein [Bordetella sp. FB-8]
MSLQSISTTTDMRKKLLTLLATAAMTLGAAAAHAQKNHDIKGLYLTTDYPAITAQAGATSRISMQLRDYGLPPARLSLSVQGVPHGWTATLLGGGQPVAAAMPTPDDSVTLQLKLKVPADAGTQEHTLTVLAQGNGQQISLPLAVTPAKELPAKLTLQPSLPSLTGTAQSSFDYEFTVKNDSGKNQIVSLAAKLPDGFEPTFTQAYGDQQVNSVPIKAGKSKDIKLSVRAPSDVKPGNYPIGVTAAADGLSAGTALQMQITGQPDLHIAGREGILSASAQSGQSSTIPILVSNTGGAAARDVQLSGSAPEGWSVTFDPKSIADIEPGHQAQVQAHITPSPHSLSGDYMATLSAQSGAQSASSDFRISVTTSSTWGVIGIAIIAIAILILVGVVARFGRR